MAYTCPTDLDGFMPHLTKADTKFRQQLGADLLTYLAEPNNSMICQDIGRFVDGLIPWMQSSNYKVSSNGIEVMTSLIHRLGHDFKPYLQTVLPAVIDRLGDSKDTVREKAQLLILKLLERNVLTPQALLESLSPGFTHKNAKIREEVLRCLINILNEYGARSVTLNKFISHIVKLLSDPTASVRDIAFNTLVDLYRHVGERLRLDLQKRNLVPATRLPALLQRFDEVKAAGQLLPTASTGSEMDVDESDNVFMAKPAVPAKKPGLLGSAAKRTVSAPTKAPSLSSGTSSAGAVDEESFARAFEDVPPVSIFSTRQISEEMKTIQETVGDSNKDWNKRTDSLKRLRSFIIAGAANYEDFYGQLRMLEIPLQASLKDLRSQVVREACITVAYMAQTLGIKFDHCAECLLNPLINLIQNSAKVVATAGHITVKFILQYTPSPRLIPVIKTSLTTSKSKDIRRSCCEYLELILAQWPTHNLERHVLLLQDAVKKGVADADPEARVSSRKAFRSFKEHFPDHAEALLASLEPNYRRALQGEPCLSSSSSSNSLAQTSTLRIPRHRPPTTQSATDSKKGFRSNSAIDLQAAQRAKARSQYSALARQKAACGTASLPRPRRANEAATMQSPERMGRTRSRSSQVSQSQPTSRSGSPSSRIPYMYNRSDQDSPRPRRLSSGIPRSTTGSREASRETSPTRGSSLSRLRTANDRPPLSPASRPVMAQKILQQSREAENALADAFFTHSDSGDYHRLQSPHKTLRSLDNHSDDSETSSLCSEKSFDSFRRTSDSYSWSGSQQRLANRDLWEPCRDIEEIISMCLSTAWQERKEGLVSLRYYINSGATLTAAELKLVTEIFTRMFMDPHTKGLCVFLDTLNDLIRWYKKDLNDWLYVLLQRIFHKSGTDLLTSTHTKLMGTLDLIKKNCPVSLQLSCVYRFLVDATQTPNSKVKVNVLTFLTSLCRMCEPGQFVSNSPLANQALLKIINYAQDYKSAEIRHAASVCIVALWNCNTAAVTMLLSELPKEQQEVASSIVQMHMQKSAAGSEPSSPLVGSSPKTLSPTTPTVRDDDFNQEEIYKSLKKTTAEIQNYSYEALGSKLDRENRDTTSQDSGISQMSLGNDIRNDVAALEERTEELTIRPNYTPRSGSRSLPYSVNGIESNTNGCGNGGDINSEELVKRILEQCVKDSPTSQSEKQSLLSQLISVINCGDIEPVITNFRRLLRIFLNHLMESDAALQIVVLQVFTAIFKSQDAPMKEWRDQFVELLILRVLAVHMSEKRDVVKMAEKTAAAMCVFPFETTASVLSPVIATCEHPIMQGAIKMLTKLIEMHPGEVTDNDLANFMPGLIKANDHEESSVRKSAVFCMVEVHKAVGEERMTPYIASLPGSKLKLLRLYITRAQESPVQNSPKNSAHSHT